jgi:uncharacterized protein (DUF4415 family)
MTDARRLAPPISDEDEAEIQRQIAEDPDDKEMTDEQFAKRLTPEEALPPGFLAAVRARRGPGRKVAKQAVTLRLDPDVVEAFKADGPGWQSRVNAALREVKKLPKRA